jgi:hypothetical protein
MIGNGHIVAMEFKSIFFDKYLLKNWIGFTCSRESMFLFHWMKIYLVIFQLWQGERSQSAAAYSRLQ